MLTIDKNIPIPERANRKKTLYRDTMELMQVGDSVFIQCEEKDYSKLLSRVTALYKFIRPKTFTSRKVANGMRLWRVR